MKKIKKNIFGIGLALAMMLGVGLSFIPKSVNAEEVGGDDFVWAYSACHYQLGYYIYMMNGTSKCSAWACYQGDGNQTKCYNVEDDD